MHDRVVSLRPLRFRFAFALHVCLLLIRFPDDFSLCPQTLELKVKKIVQKIDGKLLN
jgi:hypothetical protein